ncbi:origin recognition complex subunit 2 [Spraguea lophii 42_110]|uniref:Origin recognition complex subunit 2 n=1 Tax=Spraguea lophii (strain 42_110) TaxID=1358809 RepID=S7W8F3_SPRLO|nr:origin recognition complex subunit 2 [Spraguea lophii 42_110]
MSLDKFHINAKEEYNLLLEHYNILFYGIGCKISLLQKIFPSAFFYNNLEEFADWIENIIGKCNSERKYPDYIYNVKLKLEEYNKIITLVFIDFNYDYNFISPNIRIIGTVEKIDTNIILDPFNFIMRDMTTFKIYKGLEHIELQQDDILFVKLEGIIENIPKKSKNIFLFILKNSEKNKIRLKDLLPKIKQEFLIVSPKTLRQSLVEFIDHKIITFGTNEIILKFTVDDKKRILERYGNTNKNQ